ncbi:hypothetical protein [Legionella gresilensis]|uniref:hypothetical protein n=1 Tax=Legionella gresilensis TaxID=91823 RepID=UPI0010412A0D|nr:hypothetical protein [Legionella gresilensis]
MLKSTCPTSTSTFEEMINQLDLLANEIHLIRLAGNFTRSTVSYDDLFFSTYKRWTEKKEGWLYSEDQALILKAQIASLTKTTQNLVKNDSSLEIQAKRVLLQTYKTLINPTEEAYKQLKKIANEVQGRPNIWAQTGIVLLSILCLISGIIPGVIYIKDISQKEGAWDRYKRSGLSAETNKMARVIQQTKAADRLWQGSFFTDKRAQDNTSPDLDHTLEVHLPI